MLDLGLEVFELVVVVLVLLLHFVDSLLELIFLVGAYDFSVIVDHAAHSVLLPYLFDLSGALFDFIPDVVDHSAKFLTLRILLFQQLAVVVHSFIFAVGSSKMLKSFRPVGQIFQSVLLL